MKLELLRQRFAPQVQEVEDALAAYFDAGRAPPGHYDIIRYHLGLGDARGGAARTRRGKRLRPILCLLIGRAVGGPTAALVPLMLAAELMHSASIVHDDIQDDEQLRWGRPTVWSRFGVAQAINVGDALVGHFYERLIALQESGLSPERVLRVLQAFNRAHIRMAEGQHLDLAYEGIAALPVDAYLDVIARKTAAACECTTHAAALVAGCDEAEAERYRRFGHAFGMLYQIVDDIHSVWGEPGDTGKQALGDVLLRKATLPLLYGLSHGPPALQELLAAPRDAEIDEDAALRIRQLLTEAAIDDLCRRHAADYCDQALAVLRETGSDSGEHELLAAMTSLTAQSAGVEPPAVQRAEEAWL